MKAGYQNKSWIENLSLKGFPLLPEELSVHAARQPVCYSNFFPSQVVKNGLFNKFHQHNWLHLEENNWKHHFHTADKNEPYSDGRSNLLEGNVAEAGFELRSVSLPSH